MIVANLRKGHQIRHTLKIIGREIGVAPLPDLRQCFVYLCTEFLLAIPVLGQLPECKGQLDNS